MQQLYDTGITGKGMIVLDGKRIKGREIRGIHDSDNPSSSLKSWVHTT